MDYTTELSLSPASSICPILATTITRRYQSTTAACASIDDKTRSRSSAWYFPCRRSSPSSSSSSSPDQPPLHNPRHQLASPRLASSLSYPHPRRARQRRIVVSSRSPSLLNTSRRVRRAEQSERPLRSSLPAIGRRANLSPRRLAATQARDLDFVWRPQASFEGPIQPCLLRTRTRTCTCTCCCRRLPPR